MAAWGCCGACSGFPWSERSPPLASTPMERVSRGWATSLGKSLHGALLSGPSLWLSALKVEAVPAVQYDCESLHAEQFVLYCACKSAHATHCMHLTACQGFGMTGPFKSPTCKAAHRPFPLSALAFPLPCCQVPGTSASLAADCLFLLAACSC